MRAFDPDSKNESTPTKLGKVIAMPVANMYLAGDPWASASDEDWLRHMLGLPEDQAQLLAEAVQLAEKSDIWDHSYSEVSADDDGDEFGEDDEFADDPDYALVHDSDEADRAEEARADYGKSVSPETCAQCGCGNPGTFLHWIESTPICGACAAKA